MLGRTEKNHEMLRRMVGVPADIRRGHHPNQIHKRQNLRHFYRSSLSAAITRWTLTARRVQLTEWGAISTRGFELRSEYGACQHLRLFSDGRALQ